MPSAGDGASAVPCPTALFPIETARRACVGALVNETPPRYPGPAAMDVKLEANNSDVVIAVWDRVVVAVFRGRTTVAGLRCGREVIAQHSAACNGPILLLTLIEANAPLPHLDARVEIITLLKEANGKVERSGIVFEGEGFRASTVRAIVAGVSLFSRPEFPHRIFSSVGSAARFLVGGRSGGGMGPHRVIRVANEARRAPATPAFVPWLSDTGQATAALRPR